MTSEEPETKANKDGREHSRVKGRVRRATIDDLEAIIDINDDVYDGTDYMPALFHKFMGDNRFAIYVYETENGRLASLCNFEFHPGTDDLVNIHSIRVRQSFQGQGLGRPDANPITDQFRKEHPEITRYMIQTELKQNIKTKLENGKLGEMLYRWNYLLYKLPEGEHLTRFYRLTERPHPTPKPINLSQSQGIEWLNRNDNQLVKFLSQFANEYIVVGAKFEAVKVNTGKLRQAFSDPNAFVSFRRCIGVRASGEKVPLRREEELEDEKIALGEEIDVIGISSSESHWCKYGIKLDLHYYGNDEDDLLSHIHSHWRHFVAASNDDRVKFAFYVHFPTSIDADSVDNRLREELGETRRYESTSCATQYVQYISNFGAQTT